MEPVELHYSVASLAKLVAMGAALTLLFGWFALSGYANALDAHGVAGRLVRAIGPDGARAIGWFGFTASCGFLCCYLRLLIGRDRLAALADDHGILLRGLLHSRRLAWADVNHVAVRYVPAGGKTL